MDTAFFSHANWLAIAVAAVAYFAVGGLWYSVLFGKLWIKSTGIDMNRPDAKKGAGGIMFMTFILEFIICIALAMIASRMMLTGGVISGIKLGLLTGTCFCAITIFISYLYQMKPKTLSMIDGGYHIVGNVVASVIICIW